MEIINIEAVAEGERAADHADVIGRVIVVVVFERGTVEDEDIAVVAVGEDGIVVDDVLRPCGKLITVRGVAVELSECEGGAVDGDLIADGEIGACDVEVVDVEAVAETDHAVLDVDVIGRSV